jgi:hypothetical protein
VAKRKNPAAVALGRKGGQVSGIKKGFAALSPAKLAELQARALAKRKESAATPAKNKRKSVWMKFVTVGRFVINASLIITIEVYRPGNGSEVKVTGLEHAIRLSDKETEALIGLLTPTGGMPVPLQEDRDDWNGKMIDPAEEGKVGSMDANEVIVLIERRRAKFAAQRRSGAQEYMDETARLIVEEYDILLAEIEEGEVANRLEAELKNNEAEAEILGDQGQPGGWKRWIWMHRP